MPKGSKRKTNTRTIPYARGFRPPSSKKCIAAITHPILPLDLIPSHLKPDETSFSPISRPTSIDDWLAQYNEPGQSYQQFLTDCPWISKRKWRQIHCEFKPEGKTITERYLNMAIYLVPLGEFDSSAICPTPNFLDLLEYVKIFYNLPVKSLSNIALELKGREVFLTKSCDTKESSPLKCRKRSVSSERYLIESRYNSKTGNRQLRVHSILTVLKKLMPSDALFVIGLTMEDLFEDKTDLFVAGMAAGNHRVGVFSFSRYNPTCSFSKELWYDIDHEECSDNTKEVNKRLLLQRSCKLLVHELAHLLGVDHCIWYDCCMNGSGHLSEDFRQSMFLCPVDLNKLQTLCGFDVVERYQRMKEFFRRHKLVEEQKWIERRLQQIMCDD